MEAETLKYENLIRVLNEYGQELVNLYKNKLSANNVNATGNLSNSVKYLLKNKNNIYEIDLELADYWKYIEDGREAGKFPPISKIENWIKVKPILPTARKGKLPTEKQLVYLIARKIAGMDDKDGTSKPTEQTRKGIQPRPFLANSVEELNRIYFDKIEEALSIDLQKEFDDMFSVLRISSKY